MKRESRYEQRTISDFERAKHVEERKRFEEWRKAEEERRKSEEEWTRKEEERRAAIERKARIRQELDGEFEFYLQFVKSLALYMHNIKERVSVSKWIVKLRENTKQPVLRVDYIKLLLFCLQRRHLFSMFADEPPDIEYLPSFPKGLELEDMMRRVIAEEQARTDTGAGDLGITVETSSDLKEYVAVQKIPKYGVHLYMAVSDDPLPRWNKFDSAPIPNYVRDKCGLKKEKIRGGKSAAMRAKERRMKEQVHTKTRYEPAKMKKSFPKLKRQDIIKRRVEPSPQPPPPESLSSVTPSLHLQPTKLVHRKSESVKKPLSGCCRRERKPTERRRSPRDARSVRRGTDEFSSTDQSAGDSQKESSTEVKTILKKYIEPPPQLHAPPPPSRHSGDSRSNRFSKSPERSLSPNVRETSRSPTRSRRVSSKAQRPERVRSDQSDMGGTSALRRGGGITTFQVYRLDTNNFSSSADTSSSLGQGYNKVTTIFPRRQRTASSDYVNGTANSEVTPTTGQTITTIPRRSCMKSQNQGSGLSRTRGDMEVVTMTPRRPSIDTTHLNNSPLDGQNEEVNSSSIHRRTPNEDCVLIYAVGLPDLNHTRQESNTQNNSNVVLSSEGTIFENPLSKNKSTVEFQMQSGSTSLDLHVGNERDSTDLRRQAASTSVEDRVDIQPRVFPRRSSKETRPSNTQTQGASTIVEDQLLDRPSLSSRNARKTSGTESKRRGSVQDQVRGHTSFSRHSSKETSPTEIQVKRPSAFVNNSVNDRTPTTSRRHSSGTNQVPTNIKDVTKSTTNQDGIPSLSSVRRPSKEISPPQLQKRNLDKLEEHRSSNSPRRTSFRTDSKQVRMDRKTGKVGTHNSEMTSPANENDIKAKQAPVAYELTINPCVQDEDTKDSRPSNLNGPRDKAGAKRLDVSVPVKSLGLRRVSPIPEEILQKQEIRFHAQMEEIKRKETSLRPHTEEIKRSKHSKPNNSVKKQPSPPIITDFSTCIPKLEEEGKPIKDVEENHKESTESLISPDCYCYSKGYSEKDRRRTRDSTFRHKKSPKECGCPKDDVCLPTTSRQNDDLEKSEEIPKGIDQSYLNMEYADMREKDLTGIYYKDAPPGFKYFKFVPRGTISSPDFVISGLPRPTKYFPEDPEPYEWTKDQLTKPFSPPPSPPLTRPSSPTPPPTFLSLELDDMREPLLYRRRSPHRKLPREIVGKISSGVSLVSIPSRSLRRVRRPLVESSRSRKRYAEREEMELASSSDSRSTLGSRASSDLGRRNKSGSGASIRRHTERDRSQAALGYRRDSRIHFDVEDNSSSNRQSYRSGQDLSRRSSNPRDSRRSMESTNPRNPNSSMREHTSPRSTQPSRDRHESSRSPSSRHARESDRNHRESPSSGVTRESSRHRNELSSSRRSGESSRNHRESLPSGATRESSRLRNELSSSRRSGESSRNRRESLPSGATRESSRLRNELSSSRRSGESSRNRRESLPSGATREFSRLRNEPPSSRRSGESSRHARSP